jgi:hypothetical protein
MRDDRTPNRKAKAEADDGDFFSALRKGALIGAAVLVLVLPLRMVQQHQQRKAQPQPPVATAPAPVQPQAQATPPAQAPVAQAPQAQLPPPRLADFAGVQVSPDVKLVANWAAYTRDHGARSFVVIDKKFARVYVFDPQARLKGNAPALLGEYVGDDSVPGVGDKPLWALKPWEKTTQAGRFVAEMGENSHHQDVVWVNYDLALSMHRVIKGLPKEHRAQRLASATYKDNRISNGCINLPIPFYEKVLAPTVKQTGAIIYVIPEVKSIQKVLGAWDVTSPQQVAMKQ